jgi:hypothetical protein
MNSSFEEYIIPAHAKLEKIGWSKEGDGIEYIFDEK